MRFALLAAAFALSAFPALAQDAGRWRFGVTLAAPARVLEVNSNEVPDSNASHVDLGIGFGVGAWLRCICLRLIRAGTFCSCRTYLS